MFVKTAERIQREKNKKVVRVSARSHVINDSNMGRFQLIPMSHWIFSSYGFGVKKISLKPVNRKMDTSYK